MEKHIGIDPDFVWTPWGWLRLRGWQQTVVAATPGSAVSIQVQGSSITIKHG